MDAVLSTIDGYIDEARGCIVAISETDNGRERRDLGMRTFELVTMARQALIVAAERGIECEDREGQVSDIAGNALRAIYS